MPAIFIHDGNILDHIPAADLALGAVVVLGSLIGIAHRPIPAGALGSLAITGVWDVPVVPGLAAAAGTPVFWDAATQQATIDGALFPGAVRCGVLARPLAAADTAVRVCINH